jgi:hypothetical protein
MSPGRLPDPAIGNYSIKFSNNSSAFKGAEINDRASWRKIGGAIIGGKIWQTGSPRPTGEELEL